MGTCFGKRIYNEAGNLHSFNDEPAIDTCGIKKWYKNGVLHRDNDKPAVISNDYAGWKKAMV